MLVKEQVSEAIARMSDEFELDDIIDKLIFLDKIEQGLKDSEEGRVYTEVEAKKRLEKWLE
jgi:predicted transcriptional regulator